MRNKYTKELLTEAIKKNLSWAGVCRSFGVQSATGTQTHLTRVAKRLELDTSHFTGQGWRKGRTFDKRPLSDYLVENSTAKSDDIKKRLIAEGVKEKKCEICGGIKWNNEEMPLELHHKNRNHWDNRLENLQILCPNCHAQETNHARVRKTAKRPVLETGDTVGSNPISGTKLCITCNKEISHKATECKSCAIRSRGTKIVWPPKQELLGMLAASNYLAVSKQLGVSDNAIRKHLRTH